MMDPFTKCLYFDKNRSIAEVMIKVLSKREPNTCALFTSRYVSFTERAKMPFSQRCELITAEFVDQRYIKLQKAISEDKSNSYLLQMFRNWFLNKNRYESRIETSSVAVDETTIKEIETAMTMTITYNVKSDEYYIAAMNRIKHYLLNGSIRERICARLMIDDETLTLDEACHILDVSPRWLLKIRKDFAATIRKEAEAMAGEE